MKELKSVREIEDYITDLEKKNLSLQNTHAYRVGMAIMKFYDQPKAINKALGLKKFIKEVVNATQKLTTSNKLPSVKLSLPQHQNSRENNSKINESKTIKHTSNQYYYVPKLKVKDVVLLIDDSNEFENKEQITLTPNNFREYLSHANPDAIRINLNYLLNKPCWRGFGTYDDIKRTNEFLNLLVNSNLKKELYHSKNLTLFPLFLDRINIFDNVVVVGDTGEY